METIKTLAERIRTKELSPVELLQDRANRIEAQNEDIQAFNFFDLERLIPQATAATDEIAQGNYRGPLHGIPFGVKDMIDVEGMPTTGSSRVLNKIAERDATCVQQLREQGASALGKTETHEFAYGVTTPQTTNPKYPSKTVGGSSGGSAAAVAAGLVPFALGTDTAGSIRIPSAACGVVGIKPTYELVSRAGVLPLAWSLDHIGPIARSVDDLEIALDAMVFTGTTPRGDATPATGTLRNLRIGVASNYLDTSDGPVSGAIGGMVDRLEGEGAQVQSIELPEFDELAAIAFGILLPEATTVHHEWIRSSAELYGADVRAFLEAGAIVSAVEYLRAVHSRETVKHGASMLFSRLDVIIAPTLSVTTPDREEQEVSIGERNVPVSDALIAHNLFGSVTGLPVLAMPCGSDNESGSIGMQLIGSAYSERQLLGIGKLVEQLI